MLNYNQTIKNERIKQNMTQQFLAKGICSTSYLSKIEKEHVIPRKHIQDALLQRLNVDVTMLKISQEIHFLKELHTAYQQVIFINSIEHAQIAWNHFNEFNIEFTKLEDFYLCNLYLQRIAIIAQQPVLESDEFLDAFASILDNLVPEQQFIYFVNCSHYFLLNKNHEKSVAYLKKAQLLLFENKDAFEPWQIGDFYLLSSAVYHSIFQYSIAIAQANNAVEMFKKLAIPTPIISSYIQLGITNNRAGFNEQAKIAFEKAYNYAIQSDKKEFYGRILHNLGNTSSLLGQSKEAIQHYKNCLNYRKAFYSHLNTIHSIVKEYSKLNQKAQIKKWCHDALMKIEEHADQSQLKGFYYHFRIYQMIHEIEELNNDFIVEAIDYFLHHNDYLHLQKYTYVIAEVYMKQGDFQHATKYFKCSSEIGFKIQSRKHWQDL
ncbi:MAG: helix-turn-helix transcriptional regulator [Kurthia sp.]|nr:helix-turn-helix transcriptional regulator [Candidatus Kurthia equi]